MTVEVKAQSAPLTFRSWVGTASEFERMLQVIDDAIAPLRAEALRTDRRLNSLRGRLASERERGAESSPYGKRSISDLEAELEEEEARLLHDWSITIRVDDDDIEQTLTGDPKSIVARMEKERLKRVVIHAPSDYLKRRVVIVLNASLGFIKAVEVVVEGETEWVRSTRDALRACCERRRHSWDWVRSYAFVAAFVGAFFMAGFTLQTYLSAPDAVTSAQGQSWDNMFAVLIGAGWAGLGFTIYSFFMRRWPAFEILREGDKPRAVAAISMLSLLLVSTVLSTVAGVAVTSGGLT